MLKLSLAGWLAGWLDGWMYGWLVYQVTEETYPVVRAKKDASKRLSKRVPGVGGKMSLNKAIR